MFVIFTWFFASFSQQKKMTSFTIPSTSIKLSLKYLKKWHNQKRKEIKLINYDCISSSCKLQRTQAISAGFSSHEMKSQGVGPSPHFFESIKCHLEPNKRFKTVTIDIGELLIIFLLFWLRPVVVCHFLARIWYF